VMVIVTGFPDFTVHVNGSNLDSVVVTDILELPEHATRPRILAAKNKNMKILLNMLSLHSADDIYGPTFRLHRSSGDGLRRPTPVKMAILAIALLFRWKGLFPAISIFFHYISL